MEEYDENCLPAISLTIRQTSRGTVRCPLIGNIETIYSCETTNGQRTSLKAEKNQHKPTKQAENQRFMIKQMADASDVDLYVEIPIFLCLDGSFIDVTCFPFGVDDPN